MYIHLIAIKSIFESRFQKIRSPVFNYSAVYYGNSEISETSPVHTAKKGGTMKNIIILTHGEFSKGITQSCRMIIGEAAIPLALSIQPDSSADMVNSMLENALCDYPKDETIVLLTDIPGGSTTRSALSMLNTHTNLIIVSGLNLGLLLEIAVLESTGDLMEDRSLIEEIIADSRTTIQIVGDSTISSSDYSTGADSLAFADSDEL